MTFWRRSAGATAAIISGAFYHYPGSITGMIGTIALSLAIICLFPVTEKAR